MAFEFQSNPPASSSIWYNDTNLCHIAMNEEDNDGVKELYHFWYVIFYPKDHWMESWIVPLAQSHSTFSVQGKASIYVQP